MSWREELTRRFPALAKLGPDHYVVGGAIRDLLLGREPADVDVACHDPLEAARNVGSKIIRLGDQEHLSAYRVVLPEHVYDFAALLDDNIDTDLARRDFTINAIAVDLASGALLDPQDGQGDLQRRTVRMISGDNFDDDPLRTLKGVRMAVLFNMTIDPATLQAIRARAPKIRNVAKERVMYELSVIFSANAFRKAVELLRASGLDEVLGLGTREFHADDVTLAGALALLGGDHLGWSRALVRDVHTIRALIEHHDRIALYDAGESLARQLPAVLRALGRDDTLDMPDFSIRALLTGEEIGIPPGPELGRVKRALVEAQIRGEVKTKDEARAFVRGSA
jgi:tRNA nucleotidyltransferase/poly(A) polymerase